MTKQMTIKAVCSTDVFALCTRTCNVSRASSRKKQANKMSTDQSTKPGLRETDCARLAQTYCAGTSKRH